MRMRLIPSLALAMAAGLVSAEDRSGELAAGDQTLQSGEFVDSHSIQVSAGSRLRVQMTGENGLDSYLIVQPPEGGQYENDDSNGLHSQVDLLVLQDGLATVLATSARPGGVGPYRISTTVTEQFGVQQANTTSGSLAAGDQQMQSGEYYDLHPLAGTAGQRVVVRVTSSDFDPYLLLIGPNGERHEIDDSPGFATNCELVHELESSGAWQIGITSANPGETGSYQLTTATLTGGNATPAAPAAGGGMLGAIAGAPAVETSPAVPASGIPAVAAPGQITGSLAAGDQQMDTGEYYDIHTRPVAPGTQVQVTMRGQDGLDAYLILRLPDGSVREIDDTTGLGLDSRIEVLSASGGPIEIIATSARGGETGPYTIAVSETGRYSINEIASVTGELAATDSQLDSGEYYDLSSFTGSVGQRVLIRAESDQIDPYLILIGPNGERYEIDDSAGWGTNSELEHVLESAGEWQIAVTSAAARETGRYQMSVVGLTDIAGGNDQGQAQAGGAGDQQTGTSREYTGELSAADSTLDAGEYFDRWIFPAIAGQAFTATMTTAGGMNPYLVVISPAGEQLDNDDAPGMGQGAQIVAQAEEDGIWQVFATSLAPAETGAYALAIGGLAETSVTEVSEGSLSDSDLQLENGKRYDRVTLPVSAGERISAYLVGDGFDAYLMMTTPEGEVFENDDADRLGLNSALVHTAATAGAVELKITSQAPGQTGNWRLMVHRAAAGSAGGGSEVLTGDLADGDETLDSGEWVDAHRIPVSAGEQLTIDMQATGFDPYLIVQNTDQEQIDNDDYEGDATRSLVSLVAAGDGEILIAPTTFAPNTGGAYQIRITRGAAGEPAAPAASANTGELEDTDPVTERGTPYDMYTFEGQPGQRAEIRLTSEAFDTYLVVRSPSGEQFENDDAAGMNRNSALDLRLTESGTYRVLASAYANTARGAYDLTTNVVADSASTNDLVPIQLGTSATGELSGDDRLSSRGRRQDTFVFTGEAGQRVVLDLTSSSFDTYLTVEFPDGSEVMNDDFEGSRSRSQVAVQLPASGRYRVHVSSYGASGLGAYTVQANLGGSAPINPTSPTGAGQNFYGIFVGLSDYPGVVNDLPYCADDAVRIHEALVNGVGMPHDNGHVLTDANATRPQLEAAIRDLAGRVGPDDTFVLFFSGHGNRHDRADGPQPADPDAVDESLAMYDGPIMDDELHVMLTQINANVQMIAIDSCFSGGFAKDLISVPGRMGLFSSEEDVPSNVAAKFRAGGYLSMFLKHAVGERLADSNSDNQITVLELSQYIHEQYRAQVKSGGGQATAASFVREADLGYQHLVVDRGSIAHDHVIFPARE